MDNTYTIKEDLLVSASSSFVSTRMAGRPILEHHNVVFAEEDESRFFPKPPRGPWRRIVLFVSRKRKRRREEDEEEEAGYAEGGRCDRKKARGPEQNGHESEDGMRRMRRVKRMKRMNEDICKRDGKAVVDIGTKDMEGE